MTVPGPRKDCYVSWPGPGLSGRRSAHDGGAIGYLRSFAVLGFLPAEEVQLAIVGLRGRSGVSRDGPIAFKGGPGGGSRALHSPPRSSGCRILRAAEGGGAAVRLASGIDTLLPGLCVAGFLADEPVDRFGEGGSGGASASMADRLACAGVEPVSFQGKMPDDSGSARPAFSRSRVIKRTPSSKFRGHPNVGLTSAANSLEAYHCEDRCHDRHDQHEDCDESR